MTDPRKVLDEAVEAGARAAFPLTLDDAARSRIRAAILAALPVIGEAMVTPADEWSRAVALRLDAGEMFAQELRMSVPVVDGIAAAQRAFIERMRG